MAFDISQLSKEEALEFEEYLLVKRLQARAQKVQALKQEYSVLVDLSAQQKAQLDQLGQQKAQLGQQKAQLGQQKAQLGQKLQEQRAQAAKAKKGYEDLKIVKEVWDPKEGRIRFMTAGGTIVDW